MAHPTCHEFLVTYLIEANLWTKILFKYHQRKCLVVLDFVIATTFDVKTVKLQLLKSWKKGIGISSLRWQQTSYLNQIQNTYRNRKNMCKANLDDFAPMFVLHIIRHEIELRIRWKQKYFHWGSGSIHFRKQTEAIKWPSALFTNYIFRSQNMFQQSWFLTQFLLRQNTK